MNKFFVKEKTYKERIKICRSCEHYLKLLGNCGICGCFMKVKARLSGMGCADTPKRWEKEKEVEEVKNIPVELIKEAKDLWPFIKTGVAVNRDYKHQMVDLYNTIYGTNHSRNTGCAPCANGIWKGIKKIVEEN